MAKLIDLSGGYLPIVLVVSMLIAVSSGSFWLSQLASAVKQNTIAISGVGKTLEVLPKMTTDIALIKRELGIDGRSTASKPFTVNLTIGE